jgi:sugar phosphate permease
MNFSANSSLQRIDRPESRFRLPSVPIQILGVMCLMYLVLYIDRVNIATVAPRMMTELHLTNTQFGLAVSAFSFPYALFQLFGGWVSDRFGARRALAICGVIVCTATVFTGFVGGLGALVAARLVLGLGEGSAFPIATRAIAVWVPPARWGLAQGITHGSARLGNALAPTLIVGLLAYISWRGSFVVLGLFSVVWVALWLWIYRDDPRQHKGMSAIELSLLRPVGIAGNVNAPSVPWFRLARRMAPVTVVDFCYGWTIWVFLTWLPSFFYKSFHLDLKHSALFSSGVLLGGVAGDAVGGFLSDLLYRRTRNLQVARRNVIAIGMLGAFCFLIPVVLIHDLVPVAICLSMACFFSEIVVGPIWAVPMDIAPRYSGSASGMMNFGFGIAGILSPIVFGKILDATGSWAIPFYGSISLLLLGAVLSFFMRPDKPFEELEQTKATAI